MQERSALHLSLEKGIHHRVLASGTAPRAFARTSPQRRLYRQSCPSCSSFFRGGCPRYEFQSIVAAHAADLLALVS